MMFKKNCSNSISCAMWGFVAYKHKAKQVLHRSRPARGSRIGGDPPPVVGFSLFSTHQPLAAMASFTPLCCVVLYCVVLCCVVLHCVVLCCVVLCCVVLCSVVLCCGVMLFLVLFWFFSLCHFVLCSSASCVAMGWTKGAGGTFHLRVGPVLTQHRRGRGGIVLAGRVNTPFAQPPLLWLGNKLPCCYFGLFGGQEIVLLFAPWLIPKSERDATSCRVKCTIGCPSFWGDNVHVQHGTTSVAFEGNRNCAQT